MGVVGGKVLRGLVLAFALQAGVSCSLAAANTSSAPPSIDLSALRIEARAYEHGEGVSKDPLRAASLYCDGARQGDAEAQFSLGWI
jgi:TPR repeat protein